MTDSTPDIPGALGDEALCLACNSTDIETTSGGNPALDYRCPNYDAEFDRNGRRVNVEWKNRKSKTNPIIQTRPVTRYSESLSIDLIVTRSNVSPPHS